jgi:hypothetical protein
MSRTPTCVCGCNLIQHADMFDGGVLEGSCLNCSCAMFIWNQDPQEADIALSSPIAILHSKALGQCSPHSDEK